MWRNVDCLLTWPVIIERARVVVGIDRARGVAVDLAMDRQVTVAGYRNPLSGSDRVVVNRLGVRVGRQEFGKNAAACWPVPFLGSDVFRTWSEGKTLQKHYKPFSVRIENWIFFNNVPFRERTKDCQNLAFFDGVSFLPIMSKCVLNILAVYVVLVFCNETDNPQRLVINLEPVDMWKDCPGDIIDYNSVLVLVK